MASTLSAQTIGDPSHFHPEVQDAHVLGGALTIGCHLFFFVFKQNANG